MEGAPTRLLALFATVGLAGGCGDFYYAPADPAFAGERATATYRVSRGEVHLVAVGVAAGAGTQPTLHLSMIVRDDGDIPWRVDLQRQRVELPGGGEVAPVAAATIVVPPGTSRTIELFFALPPDVVGADHLPSFVADWRIEVNGNRLGARTHFHRVARGPTMPCGETPDESCISGYAGT